MRLLLLLLCLAGTAAASTTTTSTTTTTLPSIQGGRLFRTLAYHPDHGSESVTPDCDDLVVEDRPSTDPEPTPARQRHEDDPDGFVLQPTATTCVRTSTGGP